MFIKSLCVENCARCLRMADLHGCDHLRDKVIAFATRDVHTLNQVKATDDFAKLDMNSIMALLDGGMAQHACDKLTGN